MSDVQAANFSDLFSALFNCFLIILFGYAAGRLNIITSTQGHGIGSFIGVFALPALLFKSMVELKFQMVSWTFLLSIFLAKTILFIGIIGISLFVLRGKGLGKGGLYAIFSTQSNDFALGYPIVKVLYGNRYPEMTQYIYLVAPISLLILNPIGMLLMEIDKQWRIKEAVKLKESVVNIESPGPSDICDSCPSADTCRVRTATTSPENMINERKGTCKVLIKAFFRLLLNPIVFMVFIGLAFHFIFNGELPSLLQPLLSTLSEAFAATALFYLGLSMVGKIGKQTGVKLFLPACLIIAKILFLPILARILLLLLNNVMPVVNPHIGVENEYVSSNSTPLIPTANMSYFDTLANYAFLYGTFPTAPSVVIYAAKYGLEVDRIATGMVVCTTLSAPIMYVSAWTLTISYMDYNFYKSEIDLISKDISIVGMLTSLWCVLVFIFSKKFQKIPHLFTLALSSSMFLAAFMAVINGFAVSLTSPLPNKIIAFFFMLVDIKASRLYTAVLAISIVIFKYYGEDKVRRFQWYLLVSPLLLSIAIAIIVVTQGTPMEPTLSSPVFMFGMVQDVASFASLLFSLIVCLISLVFLFRLPHLFDHNSSSYQPLIPSSLESSDLTAQDELDSSSDSSLITVVEDDSSWWKYSSGKPQIGRHVLLLLLLCVSQLIGVVLTGWRLSRSEEYGIYFEIGFLDAVFNFGQALIMFLIFGFDEELIIDPLMQIWYRLRGSTQATLTPLSDVDQDVLKQCYVFVKHHLDNCKKALLRNRRFGLSTYSNVLTGTDLCTWLVEVGLAADRHEAVQYGQHLVEGRLLHHVTRSRNFYDKSFLYQFECRRRKVTDSSSHSLTSPDSGDVQPLCHRRRQSEAKQYSFQTYLKDTGSLPCTPRFIRKKVPNLKADAVNSESSFTSDVVEGSMPTTSATVATTGGSNAANNERETNGERKKTDNTKVKKLNLTQLTDW